MVGVGRDLCGSSSPTLLPKQGHLQQAAEDLVQVGLEYLQRRRLHNIPGQPVPVPMSRVIRPMLHSGCDHVVSQGQPLESRQKCLSDIGWSMSFLVPFLFSFFPPFPLFYSFPS